MLLKPINQQFLVLISIFRPLAYNTFGEFFNHIRASLSMEDLQSVLYMYSKMIHDSSLPPTIQVTSLKFLTNIAESIRQKGSEKVNDFNERKLKIDKFYLFYT